jgi:hypothetical protein
MPVPIYNVSFDWFDILDTRARSQDTDYATLAVSVGNAAMFPLTQYMGTLGNGHYIPNLFFNNLPVGSFQTLFINTQVINHANGSESDVTQSVLNSATKMLNLAATAVADEVAPDVMALTTELLSTISAELGSLIGSIIPVPLIGTAIGALAGWLIGEIGGFIDADCDGVVAAELRTLRGGDLWILTKDVQYSVQTSHVMTSPDGCNTSNYVVAWTVERANRPFITAVKDKNGMMHLYALSTDSEICTQFAMPSAPWNPAGWQSLPGGTFSPSTPVAALVDSDNRVHLFAVGQDGCIWTAQSLAANNWTGGGWTRISSVTFSPQTVISALMDAAGLMHLFAVAQDGHVYTLATNAPSALSIGGWSAVSNGAFTQGTSVTSLLDSEGVMHVFAVGENGQVFTNFAKPGASWVTPGWVPVSAANFSQGTSIAALLDKTGVMRLFAVQDDGCVYMQMSNSFEAANTNAWALVPGGFFTIATPVSALLDDDGSIHLFAVGKDGNVYTQYTLSSGGWYSGWVQVPLGWFNQGTIVSTLLDDGGAMNLFAAGPAPVGWDGVNPHVYNAYTAFSKPFQSWIGAQVSNVALV